MCPIDDFLSDGALGDGALGDGAFWVCCTFPNLALEALDLAEIVARPLALISGKEAGGKTSHRSSQQLVQACNASARAADVAPGMKLSAAYSRCPQLLCRDREPTRELARLKQLADIAYGFTSDVSLLPATDTHQQGLLLECAGSLNLFGGGAALIEKLQRTWQQLEHHCDLGIAHTPLAAETLARAQLRLAPDPAALTKRTQQALQRIPLVYSPWQPKVIDRFLASGLRTVGDVLALPRAALGRRFGAPLLRDLDRLTGALPDPRPTITPQPHFHASVQLLEDLRQRDGLLFPMRRLLKDLSAWLRLRQLATDSIEWRYSAGQQASIALTVNLARPSFDIERLFELSKLQLERTRLLPEINTVQLQSLNLRQHRSETLSLLTHNKSLAQSGASAGHSPAYLLDLFQARLGDTGLRGITLAEDHRPELSWRAVTPNVIAPPRMQRTNFTSDSRPDSKPSDSRPSDFKPSDFKPSDFKHGLRPLWLLPESQPVAEATLQLLRGPERINVAWWALDESSPVSSAANTLATAAATALSPSVARDYYIARDLRDVLCWVYRAHDGSGWFLHGYFA